MNIGPDGNVFDVGGSQLFPNPTSGNVYFFALKDEFEYIIKDLTGQIIQKRISKQNTIDLSGFTSGIYFISIDNNGYNKIIKY